MLSYKQEKRRRKGRKAMGVVTKTTKTKKCPYCEKIYEIYEYQGSPPARYGSPIITCSACHHTFKDLEYRELAFQKPDISDTLPVRISSIVWFAFFAYVGISMFYDDTGLSIVLLIFSIIPPFRDLATYEQRKEGLRNEKKESEKRLQDPQYALILKALGYPVPDRYLPKTWDKNRE